MVATGWDASSFAVIVLTVQIEIIRFIFYMRTLWSGKYCLICATEQLDPEIGVKI